MKRLQKIEVRILDRLFECPCLVKEVSIDTLKEISPSFCIENLVKRELIIIEKEMVRFTKKGEKFIRNSRKRRGFIFYEFPRSYRILFPRDGLRVSE